MCNSTWLFIPANDYNEINSLLSFSGKNTRFYLHIITSSFKSILRVLSPFSFWEFINVFPHTALFSCYASQFPTSVCLPCGVTLQVFMPFSILTSTSFLLCGEVIKQLDFSAINTLTGAILYQKYYNDIPMCDENELGWNCSCTCCLQFYSQLRFYLVTRSENSSIIQ